MMLSVVIPCYNHGKYLEDALSSLPAKTILDYEVIIVDDGSTEPETVAKIRELQDRGYRVLTHPNRGLAFTRNAGIGAARGEYILPLDADNRVITAGLLRAVERLEQGNCDVVYGKPSFFGENIPARQFKPKPFEGDALFLGNYIDACAVFRRKVWAAVGGYDENMPYQGNEDWEFWLKAYLNGFRFYFLDEYCYEYRITGNSMIAAVLGNEKQTRNHQYITNKYYRAHMEAFAAHFTNSRIFLRDQQRPGRSALKYLYRLFKRSNA